MILQTLKGFRDFLPQDARKRAYVIQILRKTFESFGFEPLETPALEYEEVLSGKYGDEGQKLMYRFKDHGDRDVAMRYDQTVPLARVAAQYANALPLPFKRYQIQTVWRAENTQKGRFREFLQCDIDTVGTDSLFADAEVIAVISKSLENLDIKKYKVLINDRKIFASLSKEQTITEEELPMVIRTIDKLKKIGKEKVLDELVAGGIGAERAGNILQKIEYQQPTENISRILKFLKDIGISEEKIEFLPTLARGLDYYTGTIIEVEIDGYNVGSVAGGGRYDNLVGMFAGKQIPAVGVAFGFDRLVDAMNELGLFPTELSTSKVLVTVPEMEEAKLSLSTAQKLRDSGINTEIYLDATVSLEKQLKYADKKRVPFVILFENDKTVLKNMKTGEREELALEKLIEKISS